MKAHIYLRASTKDQDADRAKAQLLEFASNSGFQVVGIYSENISGTKLQRPQLMKLLAAADPGDVLLVESIDRLSRLSQSDWARLKQILADKQLRLIVVDLPTTHLQADSSITGQIMAVINDMLIDLTSTMARLDQEKRVERIRQGLANKRAQDPDWTPPGKQKNIKLWESIERLLAKLPEASADEIATLAGCGVATVYRVKKELKGSL
ncbi:MULTISPECIES: recombinase family protein [Pseudomonas]|uniref:Resolvase n=1 Tax=Pseudomonas arsenicoxydans TaxID=702115 RepID=A0A502GV50_9PSED|nr:MULTISPECIES: recombinase family protein [Pseudomonas]NBB37065.1 recombinase family protein [Pseudomonas sp. BC115LW]TPG65764.1 resolvase [Pseudomonas arsenicoxydans]